MKTSLLLGVAVMAMSAAAPASAALLNFDITGSRTASFQLDSSPVVSSSSAFQFQILNVPGTFSGPFGTASVANITVRPSTNGGGIAGFFGGVGFFDFLGPQLFTGTTASPTFNPGTYSLFGIVSGRSSLTISAAPGAVPEPAAWAMMIGGFGLVGGAMRRRVTRVAFAA